MKGKKEGKVISVLLRDPSLKEYYPILERVGKQAGDVFVSREVILRLNDGELSNAQLFNALIYRTGVNTHCSQVFGGKTNGRIEKPKNS